MLHLLTRQAGVITGCHGDEQQPHLPTNDSIRRTNTMTSTNYSRSGNPETRPTNLTPGGTSDDQQLFDFSPRRIWSLYFRVTQNDNLYTQTRLCPFFEVQASTVAIPSTFSNLQWVTQVPTIPSHVLAFSVLHPFSGSFLVNSAQETCSFK